MTLTFAVASCATRPSYSPYFKGAEASAIKTVGDYSKSGLNVRMDYSKWVLNRFGAGAGIPEIALTPPDQGMAKLLMELADGMIGDFSESDHALVLFRPTLVELANYSIRNFRR